MRGRRVGAVAAALMVAGLCSCGGKDDEAVPWSQVCAELDRELADNVEPGMVMLNLHLFYGVDDAGVSRHCDAI